MKKAILLMAFLMGSFSAHAATEIDKAGFADAVKSGVSIVEFYSPTCGFCRKMEPTVKSYEAKNPDAKIIKFNVDTDKEFVISKGVESWPTFIIYKDGAEIYRFKGAMEYSKFERFASIKEKLTQDEVIDFRVEELEAEYAFLAEKNNRMAEEAQKIAMRLNQLPSAIEELKRLKADQIVTPDCPSGHCGG